MTKKKEDYENETLKEAHARYEKRAIRIEKKKTPIGIITVPIHRKNCMCKVCVTLRDVAGGINKVIGK